MTRNATSPKQITRVALQWARLGPYHLARLRAVHSYFSSKDIEVIAIETAGMDATYEWKQEFHADPYRREVVFPERVYEAIPSLEIHHQMTAILDRLQPDAVAITSYGTPDARACLMWCKKNRRIAILMYATKEDDAQRVWWKEAVKSTIVGLYDAALVGGTPQRRYLEKLGFPPDCIFQSCDTVDNAFFAEHCGKARNRPKDFFSLPGIRHFPYFLTSNRFIPRKNLKHLLEAYGTYRNEALHPWPLLLLGDGPEREHLEHFVSQRGIEGVYFCGFRQIEDLPAYYGLAGAFVHPAENDQWGLVVNEAMAASLPVLVSSGAGCALDLVDPGQNGYIFSPNDSAELTRLLIDMAKPDTDRIAMGKKSADIIRNWSPETFAYGLWQAIKAGVPRASRKSLQGLALLWIIQHSFRKVQSFDPLKAGPR